MASHGVPGAQVRGGTFQQAEEGSQLTDRDATPEEPAHHRRAQEAVDELARMGIDPVMLGLRPADDPAADPPPGPGPNSGETPREPPARGADASDPGPTPGPEDAVVAGDPAHAGRATTPPWAVGGTAPMLPVRWPEQAAGAPWADPTGPAPARDREDSPFRRPVRARAAALVPSTHAPDEDAGRARPPTPAVAGGGARHAVAAFAAGLFTARSAQRIQDEQVLVAKVRTPQRQHQAVVFVAGKGGVGTTTTAAGVALTVATLRDDQTALIDGQAGTDSLQRWLSDGVAATPPGLAETREETAKPPLLRLSNGLDVLDGTPWQEPAAPATLSRRIGDLQRDHTFTFIDLGDDAGATAHQALAAGTRVVVVTAADRHAARATRLTLGRIHQVQPARLRDAVIAMVCRERWQYRSVLRELREDLGARTNQIVPIPYEPALAAMDHLDLRRLRSASREAYLRVAAALAGPRAPTPVIGPDVAAAPWAT